MPQPSLSDRNSNSNGHGCMLQYALLHLYGYALSIDDLKAFRVSFFSLMCQVDRAPSTHSTGSIGQHWAAELMN